MGNRVVPMMGDQLSQIELDSAEHWIGSSELHLELPILSPLSPLREPGPPKIETKLTWGEVQVIPGVVPSPGVSEVNPEKTLIEKFRIGQEKGQHISIGRPRVPTPISDYTVSTARLLQTPRESEPSESSLPIFGVDAGSRCDSRGSHASSSEV